jgi:MerR family transcriptional regulator, light-induced transcriptional regulator
MNDASIAALPISTVERETGLSKDVLRVWERRYGFPQPLRDGNGDRVYPREQVERLQLIKRLMDAGRRPGKLVPLPVDKLQALAAGQEPADGDDTAASPLVALLREGHPGELARYLQHRLAAVGLRSFVTESLVSDTEAVGTAWMRGEISVFQEHLYTEQVQSVLRQALHALPSGSARPRVLLTTLPGEQHGLGLLMVQAIIALEGAEVRSFGTQMPITEIVAAAAHHEADVVGISFSSAYPANQAQEALTALRELLPASVELWAGGAGLRPLRRPPPRVRVLDPLEEVLENVRLWREREGR